MSEMLALVRYILISLSYWNKDVTFRKKTQVIGWRMPSPVICARPFLQHPAPELLLLFLLCIYPIMRKMTEVEQKIMHLPLLLEES